MSVATLPERKQTQTESESESGPAAVEPARRDDHLHGFRLTLRHQLILVIYFAALFAGLVPLIDSSGADGAWNAALAALLVSPWLLAVLELALDRPTPLKYWAAPVLQMLFAPAIAVSYDLVVGREWLGRGTAPYPGPIFLVNMACLVVFGVFLSRTRPLPCPACGQTGLIPVFHWWGRHKRTLQSRWCAGCGAAYWRKGREPWRVERRKVWYGREQASVSAVGHLELPT